jgi:hypothetical protein
MNGTWRNLTPWFGGLLSEQALQVRVNLAMLASDLAAEDPDAREALAAMLARTCDAVVRNGAADDRMLFETMMAERERFIGPEREALDHACMSQLQKLSEHWPSEQAVDMLVRDGQTASFLPVAILVDAVVASARELARPGQGGSEQDSARKRLVAVEELDRRATPDRRAEFREALYERLQSIPRKERRLALFALLQLAPGLVHLVAKPAELDSAARARRPSWPRFILYALVGAVAIGGVFPLFVASVVAPSGGILSGSEVGSAFVSLFFIALASGLAAATAYTPSVGRREPFWRLLLRNGRPAFVGAAVFVFTLLCFVSDTVSQPDKENVLGLTFEHPEITFAILAVVVGIATFVIAWLTPHAVFRIRRQAPDADVSQAGFIVASIIVIVAALACGIPLLFGVTRPSQFWAPLSAACGCVGILIAAIEVETLPPLRRRRGIWPLGEMQILLAIGYAVFAALIVTKVYWQSGPVDEHITVEARDQPDRKDFKPAHRITMSSAQLVQVDVAAATPHRIISAANKKLQTTYLVQKDQTFCIDVCPGGWYPMDQWLPALVFPAKISTELRVHGPSSVISPNSKQMLGAAPLSAKLIPGVAYEFDVLNSGTQFRTEISGRGSQGNPAVFLLYNVLAGDKYQPRSGPSRVFDGQLEPGTYAICAYFDASDETGCDLTDDKRVIFEGGTAQLVITAQ